MEKKGKYNHNAWKDVTGTLDREIKETGIAKETGKTFKKWSQKSE